MRNKSKMMVFTVLLFLAILLVVTYYGHNANTNRWNLVNSLSTTHSNDTSSVMAFQKERRMYVEGLYLHTASAIIGVTGIFVVSIWLIKKRSA